MIQGIQQWLTDSNEPYDFSVHSPDDHLYTWSTLPTSINPPSAGGTYSAVESPQRGSKYMTNTTPSDTYTINTPRHTSLQPLCDTSGISAL